MTIGKQEERGREMKRSSDIWSRGRRGESGTIRPVRFRISSLSWHSLWLLDPGKPQTPTKQSCVWEQHSYCGTFCFFSPVKLHEKAKYTQPLKSWGESLSFSISRQRSVFIMFTIDKHIHIKKLHVFLTCGLLGILLVCMHYIWSINAQSKFRGVGTGEQNSNIARCFKSQKLLFKRLLILF